MVSCSSLFIIIFWIVFMLLFFLYNGQQIPFSDWCIVAGFQIVFCVYCKTTEFVS